MQASCVLDSLHVGRLAALAGEQATIEYWQVKRGGGRRGIVEIVEGTP
jgi:hypothetical protein